MAERARSRWAAWTRLTWAERRLFAEAAVAIPLFAIALRLFDLHPTLRWMDARFRGHTDDAHVVAEGGKATVADCAPFVRALQQTRRHAPYPGTCLPRSLTLKWMLGRAGIASDLRIGTRLDGGRFEAHAWIERDGVILDDVPQLASRFVPFAGAVRPTPDPAAALVSSAPAARIPQAPAARASSVPPAPAARKS